ncbi:helix-turn-helix transcriptional regulator [Gordonia effusa]|nr:YafY family protein [Gordonia effusa]
MTDTASRLLRLLGMLQAPRSWSGSALAVRLEVDIRTVRRDIERLRELGYPIAAEPGVAGYRLGAGNSMPPLLLEDNEAVAMALALRIAAAGGVQGIDDSLLSSLVKLEQVLPSRLRYRITTLHDATVSVPGNTTPVDPEALAILASTIGQQNILRFDYAKHDGTSARRATEPHKLVHSRGRWYLLGWDIDKKDWRTYRVDRISPKTPDGPRFTLRDASEVNAIGRISHGTSVSVYRYQARITLLVPLAQAAEHIPEGSGVLETIDDHSCTLHTGANSLTHLAIHIAALDMPFRVEAPQELADRMTALAERITQATT